MATKDEVNGFLAQFHTKAKVFGITYFGGREKNMNTLAELGKTIWVICGYSVRPSIVKTYISRLH